MSGEGLGAKCLAEHDLVDRLVHDFLEAGHVDAGLLGVEVDGALEIGVVEGLGAVGGDADDLFHACDADAGEADRASGSAAWASETAITVSVVSAIY